ncbi:ankyrin repeat-containing domain protein [Mariannaea sp. PMI_226]|nr:ankyrin repeat-containing domain protein [Mariannaea sp. PMI_226]
MAEAVGAGANVLAFVLLGLKSAKFVYETFSIVKDGPDIVQKLATDVCRLHSILTSLHQSQAAAADQYLLQQAQQCTQELQDLAAHLQTLRLLPGDRFTGNCWKRLKVLLKEKELVRIASQINQHASLLSLRMNTLSSEATFEIKAGLPQVTQTLESTVQTGFEQQATYLRQLNESLSDEIKEMLRAQKSAPAGESIDILTTLHAAVDQIVASAQQNKLTNPQEEHSKNAGDEKKPSCTNQQFLQSVDRLSCLIDEKPRELDAYAEEDDQAGRIIDEIQQLLQSIQRNDAPVDRKYNTLSSEQGLAPLSFESGLRRLGSGFLNGMMGINQGGKQRIGYEPGIRVQQVRTIDQKHTEGGKVSLLISKRHRLETGEEENYQDRQKRRRTDYSISLTFLPEKSQDKHMIVASLSQRQVSPNGVESISTLMVNRDLPCDSQVFQVVMEGNLQELERMFRNGDASPRDHDEYGASLLMYATRQPQVCKFLIACGLDVDHVGIRTGVDGSESLVCALQINATDFEEPDDELVKVNQCRRLLLQAGADPTVSLTPKNAGAMFEHITEGGTGESVRQLWNRELTGHILDINTTKVEGMSPFLWACNSQNTTPDVLEAFLSLGANIHDRHTQTGETCLHLCISRVHPWWAGKNFDCIKLLIENGADPFATDNDGYSVAKFAYVIVPDSDGGSYAGDLWDAVVASCGYSVSQFRSKKLRRWGNYTDMYNRDHFELLWVMAGTECPYRDDEPWPPLEPGETPDDETDDDETDDENDDDDEEDDGDEEDDDEDDDDELELLATLSDDSESGGVWLWQLET